MDVVTGPASAGTQAQPAAGDEQTAISINEEAFVCEPAVRTCRLLELIGGHSVAMRQHKSLNLDTSAPVRQPLNRCRGRGQVPLQKRVPGCDPRTVVTAAYDDLKTRLRALSERPEVKEKLIREDLGYVKKDELIFHFAAEPSKK